MRCRSVATTATVSKPKARSTVGNKATLEEKFRLRDKARPILRPICVLFKDSGQCSLHKVEKEDFAWINRIYRQLQRRFGLYKRFICHSRRNLGGRLTESFILNSHKFKSKYLVVFML